MLTTMTICSPCSNTNLWLTSMPTDTSRRQTRSHLVPALATRHLKTSSFPPISWVLKFQVKGIFKKANRVFQLNTDQKTLLLKPKRWVAHDSDVFEHFRDQFS